MLLSVYLNTESSTSDARLVDQALGRIWPLMLIVQDYLARLFSLIQTQKNAIRSKQGTSTNDQSGNPVFPHFLKQNFEASSQIPVNTQI